MHRDTVTQVAVAQDQDFLLTGSIDGHLKFWKKTPTGIEFAKHYRAHVGSLDGAFHCSWHSMSPHSSRHSMSPQSNRFNSTAHHVLQD